MAKRDDTAPSDLRDLLVMLRDALGQPPVGALPAAMAIRAIRLLAEQDLGKRRASPRPPDQGAERSRLANRQPGPG